MDLAGFRNFRKHCFKSSCWTRFIDISFADDVERQIVPRIISQVGEPGWLSKFLKALLNQVAGLGLLIYPLLMV